MGHPAVDDVRERDAAVDRLQARRELRTHAARDRVQRALDLVGARLRDDAVGIVCVAQPAGHIGQKDDLVGAQRARDGAGGLVGVDVVGMPVAISTDARHHGDVVLGHVLEHVDIDALDLADEADVLAAGRSLARGAEQQAVVAAQPNRGLPVAAEPQHDVLVDLADQDHLRDLDRRRVGDPQAVDELNRQIEPLHVDGDLRAAAVDDDRVHAHVLEQHHVARELLLERRIGHRRAAVLDHDRLAVELADVGQRFEQRGDVAHRLRWCSQR